MFLPIYPEVLLSLTHLCLINKGISFKNHSLQGSFKNKNNVYGKLFVTISVYQYGMEQWTSFTQADITDMRHFLRFSTNSVFPSQNQKTTVTVVSGVIAGEKTCDKQFVHCPSAWRPWCKEKGE